MNSDAKVEAIVSDLVAENAIELLSGFPLVLDGTDNFETRLLINDAAVFLGVPWIYAAAVGSYGLTFTIRPSETACLACLLESSGEFRRSDFEETCDTAGILNSAASLIASIESAEALKFLSGNRAALNDRLVSCDVWKNRFQSVRVERNPPAAPAPTVISLISKAKPSHTSLCADATPSKSTSAAAISISANSAAASNTPSPAFAATISCFASRFLPTK